jgi:ureidoglycolate amidohydrolase
MNRLPNTSKETIQRDIDAIDMFNSTPGYGTTRILFTDEELKARKYVKKRMAEIGLSVTEDGIGNIYGTLVGEEPELAPVWTGSHIDTVKNAGKFDGMAGVVAGMEALRVIKESGIAHQRNLQVIVFTSEEPTRFGVWGIGSHAMAGLLSRDDTRLMTDEAGNTLESILIALGFDIDTFPAIKKSSADVHAFIELHIEQAPVLDRQKIPIGIVETICGLTSLSVTISGVQGHAGGTPKHERIDPVPAFCDMCLRLESLIYTNDHPYLVGTIGKVTVTPNASNVIAQKVEFSVDIRDRSMATKDEILAELNRYARELEDERNVKIDITVHNHEPPVHSSHHIIDRIGAASELLGYDNLRMVSGAFHDAVMVAEFAPIGMIFVPCRDGVSHSPDEWADCEDIRKGADVLAHALLELAHS